MAAPALISEVALRSGWSDVVEELEASSVARAPIGGAWVRPGVVAVVAGPAQMAWVHGPASTQPLLAMLAGTPGLRETYVCGDRPDAVEALVAAGWSTGEVMQQLVHLDPASATQATGHLVAELGHDDLPAIRTLLEVCGCGRQLLESHYPDEFFLAAAPVRVFGVREDDRLVASVAVRRQSRGALGFALNVHPERRRHGLATAVVSAGLRAAAELGAGFVQAQANEAAADCLRGCGFDRVGTWRRMYRD